MFNSTKRTARTGVLLGAVLALLVAGCSSNNAAPAPAPVTLTVTASSTAPSQAPSSETSSAETSATVQSAYTFPFPVTQGTSATDVVDDNHWMSSSDFRSIVMDPANNHVWDAATGRVAPTVPGTSGYNQTRTPVYVVCDTTITAVDHNYQFNCNIAFADGTTGSYHLSPTNGTPTQFHGGPRTS